MTDHEGDGRMPTSDEYRLAAEIGRAGGIAFSRRFPDALPFVLGAAGVGFFALLCAGRPKG